MKRHYILMLVFFVCLALLCACGGLQEEEPPSDSFTDRIVSICYFGVDFNGRSSAEDMVECDHSRFARQIYKALRLTEWQQTDGSLEGMAEDTVIFIPYIGGRVHVTFGANTARLDGKVYRIPDGVVDEITLLLKEHVKEHG